MKLYQKILIGIVVGMLFGTFLGPQSPLFGKETLHVIDPGKLTFLTERGDASSRLDLAPEVTTDFTVIGEAHEGKTRWYEVSFAVKAKHLVGHELTKADGKEAKAGDILKAWVKAQGCPPKASGLGLKIMRWVDPIGEIFLRLILMLVVPLVFTTLTVGVAQVGNVKALGRLGVIGVLYFVASTSLAIILGMALAFIIRPGTHVTIDQAHLLGEQFDFLIADAVRQASATPDILRFVVEIVPDNPIHSMASASPNILQVMFFSILFGVALTMLPPKRSKQVLSLMDQASRVLIMVMHMVMAVAPIGVASVIAQTVGATGFGVIGAMGLYIGTVVLGLVLFAVFVVSLVVARLGGVGVRPFWRAIWPAQVIALGTASSSATLPVSLECAEDNLGVSKRVSSFCISLGASIHMPGTALFQGAAVVFIAQVFGVELSASALVTVFIAILLLSAGTAAVPGAGIISLALALSSIGLPPVGIALVVGFDRVLDMIRTPLNVAGDLSGSLVLARATGEPVRLLVPEEDAQDPDRGFEHRLDVPETPYRDDEAADEEAPLPSPAADDTEPPAEEPPADEPPADEPAGEEEPPPTDEPKP